MTHTSTDQERAEFEGVTAQDPLAAIRRAIVQVAAEIGKVMP